MPKIPNLDIMMGYHWGKLLIGEEDKKIIYYKNHMKWSQSKGIDTIKNIWDLFNIKKLKQISFINIKNLNLLLRNVCNKKIYVDLHL